jgi:hypothetical protein
MNMLSKVAVITGLLIISHGLGAPTAVAQTIPQQDEPVFGKQELRFDVFGTWATRDRRHMSDDHAGVGLGVDYFLTPNVGIAAESYIERFSWPSHLDVSLVGRIPIESLRFAPYLFGGGGRQWRDGAQWTAHIGGGVEFRMSRKTGIFIDAREVFADRGPDFELYRLGFRFGF